MLRPGQRDNGCIDGRSPIQVNTDERTQVHSARYSMVVTHPRTSLVSVADTDLCNLRYLDNCITPSLLHLIAWSEYFK